MTLTRADLVERKEKELKLDWREKKNKERGNGDYENRHFLKEFSSKEMLKNGRGSWSGI